MSKIALLYDSVLDFGGVENHILSILTKGEQSRYEYLIFSNATPRFVALLQELDIEIVPMPSRHPLNPLTIMQLIRQLREKEIDLIHAHSPTSALWGRIAANLVNIPSVVTVHLPVTRYHGSLNRPRSVVGRRLYNTLDRLLNQHVGFTKKMIYVSENDYQQDISGNHSPKDRCVVIPNGINMDRFLSIDRENARKELNLPPGRKVIIFVGRLDEQKGIDTLIQSIKLMSLNQLDFKVWLVGDGPLREELVREVDLSGETDYFVFWGYQENTPRFLRAADIFVLPSRYEGMSFALLEGMAAGLPCVVTDSGENHKLILDGVDGFVVPMEDPVSLGQALEALLVDQDLCNKMSKNVQQHVHQFSAEKMVLSVEQVYNQCLTSTI